MMGEGTGENQNGVVLKRSNEKQDTRTHGMDSDSDSTGTESEEKEKEVLLNNKVLEAELQTNQHVTERIRSCLARQSWNNLAALVLLWMAYCTCAAAFSLMGPFFPEEVGGHGSNSPDELSYFRVGQKLMCTANQRINSSSTCTAHCLTIQLFFADSISMAHMNIIIWHS